MTSWIHLLHLIHIFPLWVCVLYRVLFIDICFIHFCHLVQDQIMDAIKKASKDTPGLNINVMNPEDILGKSDGDEDADDDDTEDDDALGRQEVLLKMLLAFLFAGFHNTSAVLTLFALSYVRSVLTFLLSLGMHKRMDSCMTLHVANLITSFSYLFPSILCFFTPFSCSWTCWHLLTFYAVEHHLWVISQCWHFVGCVDYKEMFHCS